MARKKTRRRNQQNSSHLVTTKTDGAPATSQRNGSTTAITSRSPDGHTSTSITAEQGGEKSRRKSIMLMKEKASEAPQNEVVAWLVRIGKKMPKILGALQLAVFLLSSFTFVVFLGVLLEHFYSTSIAQTLVYKSWWFNFLLFMLGVNIFFAAVKKWPWKKHQTGFIITHIGLITMVFGGLLNYFWGVDAYMQLVDTGDPVIQNNLHVDQTSNRIEFNGLKQVRVTKILPRGTAKNFTRDFTPGALPWEAQPDDPTARADLLISFLNWLQCPLGRSWSMSLGDGAWLEVTDFIPFAQKQPFVKAKTGEPAMKIQFSSNKFAAKLESWIATRGEYREFRDRNMALPLLVEIIGHDLPSELVESEFLHPPAPEKLGEKGILAVHYQGQRLSIDVAEHLKSEKMFPLGDTGLAVKLTKYIEIPPGRRAEIPAQPVLGFELYRGDKKISSYAMRGREQGALLDLEQRVSLHQGQMGLPLFWFHVPDVTFGKERVMGVLEFALSTDGKIHYRSFSRDKGNFALEKSGLADAVTRDAYPIWGRMGWKFRVLEYFPHAEAKDIYTPVGIAQGKETKEDMQRFPNAVRCRLTTRDVDTGKTVDREFWLEERTRRTIALGGAHYEITYTSKYKNLDFEVALDRAQTTVDPGTMSPASYSSNVRVFDKKNGVTGKREYITMNHPLEYGGYTFYQSDLRPVSSLGMAGLGEDAKGQAVNLSGFTVAFDPGIPFKYIGSIMLALGIFTMFYMKAYFFKPKRRRKNNVPPQESDPAAGGPEPSPAS